MQYKRVVKAAFPHTIPVLTGYLFLGIAFGILASNKGISMFWCGIMSIIIYSGSMQFVATEVLTRSFDLVGVAFLTLMVNARYMFYGLSMLDTFKDFGAKKPYMVFSLTDETFSLLCTAEPPEEIDKKQFLFCIALFNHIYWLVGALVGAFLGTAVPFDFAGIDFVMTALFVVIFVEQMRQVRNRIPSLIGLLGSLVCLLVFGPEHFILPAMAVLIGALSAVRTPLERGNAL